MSQQMHAQIPDSELVILDGAAHAAILEAADQANEAILTWSRGTGHPGVSEEMPAQPDCETHTAAA